MKKILAILLSLLTLPNCSKEKDKSIFESLSIATLRKDRVTLTGSAVKGLIKNADIKIHPVLSDGTCNTKTVLGSAISDQAGEYSVFFNRGSGVVCIQVKANADGSTRMFNEKLNQDISVLPNSDFNLTSIVTEDKISGNSKGNNLVSPFSKFAARRLANLMSNSGNSANLSTLNRKASKEVVIRFGLNAGLSAANARTETLTRNVKPAFVLDVNYPEMDDIDIQLGNLNNPLSVKYITVLAGFSYLANQFKRGTVSTADDVNSVIDSFAKDFEDGVFDGKDSTGKVVTIGTGSNQRDLPVDSITNLLLPAINAFIQEGGRIGVGENSISLPLTSLSQVQFLDSVSILSVTPGTGTGTGTPANLFTLGGSITGLGNFAGLVINSGGSSPQTISPPANATTFQFPNSFNAGYSYNATITTSPAGRVCSITSGATGTTVAGTNTSSIVITCRPISTLYVLNANDANIRVFNTDDNGNLTLLSTVATTLTTPSGIIYNGKHLVVTSLTSIRSYLRNPDGTLTFAHSVVSSNTECGAGGNCFFHPSGLSFFVHAPNGGGNAGFFRVVIDTNGIISAPVYQGSSTANWLISGAMHPSGSALITMHTVFFQRFWSLNPSNGIIGTETNSAANIPTLYPESGGCEFSTNGNFLYCNQHTGTPANNNVFQSLVTLGTNSLTNLAAPISAASEGGTAFQSVRALKLSPLNDYIYVYGRLNLWSFNVNTGTGIINPTPINSRLAPSSCPSENNKTDLAIHTNGNTLYSICASTGNLGAYPLTSGNIGAPTITATASGAAAAQRLLFVTGN
ncbi:MAG TPA: hypothetical protein PLG41_20710 [Leptospiraceae bacterium]|nr:hypothetical protein [Leptospiraceae bacterium]